MSQQQPDDKYARESFTFRRMTRPQLWAISIAVLIIGIALIVYVL